MGKGKKKKDPEKKAALQAKKEAKADKATRKRLQKEANNNSNAQGGDSAAQQDLDDLLQQYKASDVQAKEGTVVENLSGFPLARANATLTLYEDGKKKKNAGDIYLFGGEFYDGIENVVLDHLLRYEAAKGTWQRIHTPISPPPRCAHSTVYYNHALYIFGGEMATSDAYHHYKDVWRFDLKKQTWEEIRTAKASAVGGGTPPSPRSGHLAAVWKHYMVIFGGFYEASRDTPRWYNDVCIMDLQTQQWLPVPHSKLSARPEPRSAVNDAIVGDDLVIHGGFSKLTGKARPSTGGGGPPSHIRFTTGSLAQGGEDGSILSETRVHSDAWILHLKPILAGKPPTWERLTSSSSSLAATPAGLRTTTPNGRAGTGSTTYKDRLLAFGGVIDQESHHHKLKSVFYNDLCLFDVERRKWFPVIARDQKSSGEGRRRRKQGEADQGNQDAAHAVENDEGDEEDSKESDDNLEDVDENDQPNEDKGWNLNKLRSNMFAFLDGDGNVVYEKIDDSDDEKQSQRDADEETKEDEDEAKEEAKEEEKEEEDEDGDSDEPEKTSSLNASNAAANAKVVTSSSAMMLNPETHQPEVVKRDEPLPRINSSLVVSGHTLYVYGGLLEVGDREVTLDDMWSFDLKKRSAWECIYPGTMHRQVWRGAEHDDDDSYFSTERTGKEEDDEDEDEDNQSEGEEDGDVDTKSIPDTKASSKSGRSKLKTEIRTLCDKHNLDNDNIVQRPGEAMSDFYSRTSTYWNQKADEMAKANGPKSNNVSSKELKREGFALSKARFEELEPILKKLQSLNLEYQSLKEKGK